jgi:hypothetical protein
MARHYSTRDFFRQMPNPLLARYFHERKLFGDLDFAAMKETQPDRGITFTMPDLLWRFFRDNPPLAKALSALAAEVIRARVSAKYGLRAGVLAILHTFNGKLEYNSHVHTMVTGGGLHGSSDIWVARVYYDRDALMEAWRRAVIALLRCEVILRPKTHSFLFADDPSRTDASAPQCAPATRLTDLTSGSAEPTGPTGIHIRLEHFRSRPGSAVTAPG